jgi:HAD superfamily hydrolase (TIGR01509 family)
MNKDAIIFDMDGVLLNSIACHEKAFADVLKKHGIKASLHYDAIAGKTTEEAFQSLLTANHVPFTEDLIDTMSMEKRLLAQTGINKDSLDPELVPVLTKLSERFVLALGTGGSRQSTARFLELSGVRHLFRSVVCSSDVQRGKPAPDIFLRNAQEMGIAPAHCTVIEDSEAGLRAAITAGMQVIFRVGTLPQCPTGIHALSSISRLTDLFTVFSL